MECIAKYFDVENEPMEFGGWALVIQGERFSFMPCNGQSIYRDQEVHTFESPGPLLFVIDMDGVDAGKKWIQNNPDWKTIFGPAQQASNG